MFCQSGFFSKLLVFLNCFDCHLMPTNYVSYRIRKTINVSSLTEYKHFPKFKIRSESPLINFPMIARLSFNDEMFQSGSQICYFIFVKFLVSKNIVLFLSSLIPNFKSFGSAIFYILYNFKYREI